LRWIRGWGNRVGTGWGSLGKFGFCKEAVECARKNAIIFMACL